MTSVTISQLFCSILWPGTAAPAVADDAAEPNCFHDLKLDQLVAGIAAAWPQENLAPLFRTPLQDRTQIAYRQAVVQDLARTALRGAVETFVERLRATRTRLGDAEKLQYRYEKERAFLAAAEIYGNAVQVLGEDLTRLRPESEGLRALEAFVREHVASDDFRKLADDTRECLAALDTVRYGLVIRINSVTVRPFEDEPSAGADIEATFARFRPDADNGADSGTRGRIGVHGLNHIEAQILDKVALLHPAPFAALDAFCTEHDSFIDPALARFAREVCFYLAWLACTDRLRAAGLPFCLPELSVGSNGIEAHDAFDITLAQRLSQKSTTVVRNDFALRGRERILLVTGPNHGGKTTFARMIGQVHWLAALGLSVPATRARLALFDRLFTHFEREEDIATLRGKLKDDLVRIHTILAQATPHSLIILNEIFASTTLDDALQLGHRVMARIERLDALAVCVTFLTELSASNDQTVSMVAGVDPRDPAIRTFKLERRPADGLAYALAVARKYRVTRDALLQRIAP